MNELDGKEFSCGSSAHSVDGSVNDDIEMTLVPRDERAVAKAEVVLL